MFTEIIPARGTSLVSTAARSAAAFPSGVRTRDVQRRLLGGGEAAKAHVLATTKHPRLVGLGLAGLVEVHAEVTRLVLGQELRQLLRLRLLLRLLAPVLQVLGALLYRSRRAVWASEYTCAHTLAAR